MAEALRMSEMTAIAGVKELKGNLQQDQPNLLSYILGGMKSLVKSAASKMKGSKLTYIGTEGGPT